MGKAGEKGKQRTKCRSVYGKQRKKLRATLTEQQKEMLDKYRDSYNELMSICEREAFTVGFILATRIMVEVMQGLTEVEDI